MYYNLKLLIKNIIPFEVRRKVKSNKRRLINNIIKKNNSKTSLLDVRKLLKYDFDISKGDNIIVASSFGNLNAEYTPKELISLLQDIVSKEGNIVMPFYPPGNSYEWAKSGKIFDMKMTPSSMGILTQTFSEMPDVLKSKHPTKAVVVWGKNAEEIVKGHEYSTTPFYWDSPYGWFIINSSKSLGLGLKNIPIFHSIEDIILEKVSLYKKDKVNLKLKDYNAEIFEYPVLIHDPRKIGKLVDAGDYVRNLNATTYRRKEFGYSFCYIIDNQELFDICKNEFNSGNLRDNK